MLRDPILQAKELAAEKNAEESLRLFIKIFNIEHLVEKQKKAKQQPQTDKKAVQPSQAYI